MVHTSGGVLFTLATLYRHNGTLADAQDDFGVASRVGVFAGKCAASTFLASACKLTTGLLRASTITLHVALSATFNDLPETLARIYSQLSLAIIST